MLKPEVSGYHRQSAKVFLLRADDCGIDSQPGSVVYVSFHARAISRLINQSVLADEPLGARQTYSPTENRIVRPVGQIGGDAAEQCGKLDMSAAG